MDPTLQLVQVIEVNNDGDIIDYLLMDPYEINQAIDEGRKIIMNGWSERLFQPKYDFTSKEWIEGLTSEEVEQREEEIQKELNKPDESNMISLAILELAVEMEKIKEGMK